MERCQTAPSTCRIEYSVKVSQLDPVAQVFLGIDYGSRRVGLSHADELGFAFPLLVLGYPLSVEGDRTNRCDEVEVFAAELTRRFALPIEKVDEALTSQAADEFGGRKARSANERKQQARTGERDSRAAAVLLQDFLNSRGLGS